MRTVPVEGRREAALRRRRARRGRHRADGHRLPGGAGHANLHGPGAAVRHAREALCGERDLVRSPLTLLQTTSGNRGGIILATFGKQPIYLQVWSLLFSASVLD